MTNVKHPIPLGFADDAPRYHVSELVRRYRAGHGAIERWCNELGVKPAPPPPQKHELPEDFVAQAQTMMMFELMRLYDVTHGVIKRWRY